jgi:hypothetical protein
MTQEEKTNKMQNAKRTDRKYLIRFLLICMGTAILGANVGLGLLIVSSIYFYEKNNGQGDGTFQSIFGLIFLGVFMIGLILLIGISLYNYSKAKKMSMSWNNEDEEVMDAIDKRQNKAKLWNNILMVYSFLFFALSISASGLLELSERTGEVLPELSMFRIISFFGSLLIFIVSIVFYIVIYKRVVDLQKRLSPEKQGSIFDFQFFKKWEASSDEAQKQTMYKAGYRAFRAANLASVCIWLIAFLAQMFFGTGVFPVVCICFVWLVLNVSYSLSVMSIKRQK